MSSGEPGCTGSAGEAGGWQDLGRILLGLEERGLRWAALGEVDSVVRWGREATLPDPVELLVSPYDAPRVQLHLVTRGLRVRGEPGADQVTILGSAELRLAVHAHLTRRGWADLPLSVFLDSAEPAAHRGVGIRLMEVDAAWAAEVLLMATDLFAAGSVGAPRLARLARLAAGTDAGARSRWDDRMALWGVRRAWARACEVLSWVEGGPRPDWLPEGFGEGPAAAGRQPVTRAEAVSELALLDRPWGVLRWIALRSVHRLGRLFG